MTVGAVRDIFISPLADPNRWQDLGVKAAPLIIIAVGLAIGFRANVWNIGAEGQYIIGALAGTGVALATWGMEGPGSCPLMCVAGVLGGMAWAAIPAFLRTRLDVNEILTSLMLTYVAIQLLYYLINGPWKDPMGFNFPQTAAVHRRPASADRDPAARSSISACRSPLVIAVLAWLVMTRTVFGFQIRVVGHAPARGPLCRLQRRPHDLGHAADRRRPRRARRHLRGAGPVRPDGAAIPRRLRLHRHHRGLSRPAASDRHRPRRPGHGAHLCRRRDRADPPRPAAARPASSRRMLLFFLLATDVLVRYRVRVAPAGAAGMSSVILVSIIMSVVGASTPILLAALGELVAEKSGVLNLGVEGMMLIGAVTGFAVTFTTGSPWIGVIAAAFSGAAVGADLRLPHAHAHVEPGGDRPRADHLRHLALVAGRRELRRPDQSRRSGSIFPDALADNPLLRLLFGHSPSSISPS